MPRPSAAYLGIDAGGSKTAWVVLDEDGVVGEGAAEPIQVTVLGPARAARRLAAVVEAAATATGVTFAEAVAGLAGAGSASVQSEMSQELAAAGLRHEIQLLGDVSLAAAAALAAAPGVAVWSGTGSFAVARDRSDRLHRVGGRGWLLGDLGSGFDLARRAATAVVAAADGMGDPTALTAVFLTALQVDSPFDLGRRVQAEAPRALAALYPLVRQVADGGDVVARAIRRDGAAVLARHALAAGERADLPPPTTRVFLGGGVLLHDDGMRALVQQALADAGVRTPPELCSCPPARGAAALARARARGEPPLCRWSTADGIA